MASKSFRLFFKKRWSARFLVSFFDFFFFGNLNQLCASIPTHIIQLLIRPLDYK
jgi:hypothetical protein